jgi:hypothetical protein
MVSREGGQIASHSAAHLEVSSAAAATVVNHAARNALAGATATMQRDCIRRDLPNHRVPDRGPDQSGEWLYESRESTCCCPFWKREEA